MKSLVAIFLVVGSLWVGCHNSFHIQQTKMAEKQLPIVCAGLVELINKQWIKHRSANCRFDNGVYKTLEKEYANCLKELSRAEIIELLGEPDAVQMQFIYYYFDEKCTNKSRSSQKFLRLGFDKDKVYFLESGTQHSTS